MGSVVVVPGASFCSNARVPATITVGHSSSLRTRHIVRMRAPIVWTAGLTRSKGSVSHAGKSSTDDSPRNAARSSATSCAIVPVGVAMTMGRRPFARVMPARTAARAASGTAITELRDPAMASMPGSCETTAASDSNGMRDSVFSLTVRCTPAWQRQGPLSRCAQLHHTQFPLRHQEPCALQGG
ncbi:unannotated protein [freshwater metagenome]|uniref:Unannotated protein n=1 Tax=freshwater metagenome TaxID=449393 RepID=A0A6J6ICL2_9ZZZZ